MIEVVATGSGLSLQDIGRREWRRFGVPSGGAMDRSSMALANALLGNPVNAPVLEITLLGARLRLLSDCWLALAGADFNGRFKSGTAMPRRAGDVLEFSQRSAGLYAYLAVPGGFCADRWLGSASSDPRNGMGRMIRKGDYLNYEQVMPHITTAGIARRISSRSLDSIFKSEAHFELYPGAQYDTFCPQERDKFIRSAWTISKRSDRAGYRLEGAILNVPETIPSEPVLPGCFQVPGNGRPIITMHDGPTVGGYAKIAVLKSSDLDRLAQCAPGSVLTFSWID